MGLTFRMLEATKRQVLGEIDNRGRFEGEPASSWLLAQKLSMIAVAGTLRWNP